MSGSRKEELAVETAGEEVSDEREVYLRDGRKLVVSEQRGESLVEIRGASGMLEVKIRLTEQGPVLQMESARMQLKASEAVEIESARVEIKGTERVELAGGNVKVHGDEDVEVDATNDVRVTGKMIWLN
jgi:hypothetical protein